MNKALLLFSEGLDSTLAGLILKREGLEVIALRFITPFFGWQYKKEPKLFHSKCQALSFDSSILFDITEDYLEILKYPRFGYGEYANPCLDCKILLLKKAKEILHEVGADFLASGEVLGQRSTSQSKGVLETIEKEADVKGLLLRPLSAKLLKITEPEKKGIIKRENLYAHCGRQRSFQLELAQKFGLKDIPTPAGGCLLTDPIIGSRILKVLKERRSLTPLTAELLIMGRHFFEGDLWIILGRNEVENNRILELAQGIFPLYTLSEPSPISAVIEGKPEESILKNLLLKYSKKAQKKLDEGGKVALLSL